LEKGSCAPVSVHWPLLYAEKDFVGKLTLLSVWLAVCSGSYHASRQGHAAEALDFKTGLNDAPCVTAARVVWAQESQSALELLQLDAYDHEWLRFVHECEHSSVS